MSFIFSRHSCCCISVFSPRIRLSAIIYSDPWIKNGGGRKYDFRRTVHVITTLHIIFIAPKGSRTSDLYPNHGAYNYCFIIKVNVFFCRRFAKKNILAMNRFGIYEQEARECNGDCLRRSFLFVVENSAKVAVVDQMLRQRRLHNSGGKYGRRLIDIFISEQ